MTDEKDISCSNSHLRNERLRRQWTQQDLADHLGTTKLTVGRWERGVTVPGPYFRLKLCTLFGKQAHELGLLVHETAMSPPPAQDNAARLCIEDPCLPAFLSESSLLVGRQEILGQMVDRLCTQQELSYALTGLPGVGKTLLAMALAHHPRIRQHFPDGILWVGLGPTPAISEALSRWGMLLEVPVTQLQTLTTADQLARCLHQRIGHRRLLLVLDDAWSLVNAITFHIGGKHCTHLLTTRFPTLAHAFAQEQVTLLEPFTDNVSLLLLQRLAPHAWQQYPQELQSLAQKLDGHPLALTLIGRSLHRQSLNGSPRRLSCFLQHLNQDIQARFHLAEPLISWKYSPGYPAGTAISLQTALDSSVHHLPLSAQTTLRALAIFAPKPQHFSEEAALAVCPGGTEDLDLLVDSGLVEACHEGRYQIHQTIVDYAHLQGIDPEIEDRLVTYVVTFVKSHEQQYAALEQDLPTITVAFELAFTRKQFEPLLQGIFALMPFVKQRLLYSLAEKLLNAAHQAAISLNDQDALARHWLFRGMMIRERGDALGAQQAYLQGLALARQLSQSDLLIQFLVHIGGTLVDTEMGSQAETYLIEGWERSEASGDHTSLCEIFLSLGELATSQGKSAKASHFFERGLASALQIQNWKTAAALLQNLGVEAGFRGEYEQAIFYHQRGLAYAQQQKDLPRQSAILMNLGMLAWYQHQEEKAITLSRESLRLAREIEHQMRISSVLQNLGMMMRVRGEYTQAAEYLQESLARAMQIGHRWLTHETLYEQGMLSLKQQQHAQAKQTFEEIRQQAQAMQAPFLIGLALFGLAQVAEQEGQRVRALNYAQESQTIFRALNNVVWSQTIEDWQTTLALRKDGGE